MKNVLILAFAIGLTACAKDIGTVPAPVPPVTPSVGLSCDVYDLTLLAPTLLPIFSVAPTSGAVVTGTVYAGSPVAKVTMTGSVDYSTPSAMSSPLTTWYGLNCKAKIMVKVGALYKLKLTSDDGSKLLIDDALIINNDGQHGAVTKSANILLSAGEHDVNLQYMEGVGPVMLKLESNLPMEFYNY